MLAGNAFAEAATAACDVGCGGGGCGGSGGGGGDDNDDADGRGDGANVAENSRQIISLDLIARSVLSGGHSRSASMTTVTSEITAPTRRDGGKK